MVDGWIAACGTKYATTLRCLVAVPPVEALPDGSSTEQISVWIWEQLAPGLPLIAVERPLLAAMDSPQVPLVLWGAQ